MTLRDVLARISRALEALHDSEGDLAEQILDDLAAELWQSIERSERAA